MNKQYVIEGLNEATGQWHWDVASPRLSLDEATLHTLAEAEEALRTAPKWCGDCKVRIATL